MEKNKVSLICFTVVSYRAAYRVCQAGLLIENFNWKKGGKRFVEHVVSLLFTESWTNNGYRLIELH